MYIYGQHIRNIPALSRTVEAERLYMLVQLVNKYGKQFALDRTNFYVERYGVKAFVQDSCYTAKAEHMDIFA